LPETDILVNNVGAFKSVPFEQIDDASWIRLFETNVMSGVRLSRHYFPRMLKRGWGASSSSPASRPCRFRPR